MYQWKKKENKRKLEIKTPKNMKEPESKTGKEKTKQKAIEKPK